MNQQNSASIRVASSGLEQELFVLTDEQILEIEPEQRANQAGEAVPPRQAVITSERSESRDRGNTAWSPSPQNAAQDLSGSSQLEAVTPVGMTKTATSSATILGEPPKWLADMMADPQSGAEARDLWSGVQQASQEAAAFREVFAKPEEARAAAERARTLDEVDAAFYGGAGKSPQEMSAARSALAQRMMREDPAAFREMVLAGLRALEEAGRGESAPGPQAARPEVVTQAFRPEDVLPAAASSNPDRKNLTPEALPAGRQGVSYSDTQAAAYRAFEKAANEELERSVGGAIERTVSQAVPNISKTHTPGQVGAQHAAPLHVKLQAAIREDIEAALKGDRQLGEQIGQILASRQFDDTTRAQVVRLINDRAQQLVPSAAKRVIGDWTQTTLAAHRSKTQKTEVGASRADIAAAEISPGIPRLQPGQTGQPSSRNDNAGSNAARIDYRKLSDEQILDL